MAPEFEPHVSSVQTVLVRLLDRLQDEGRCMTPDERQRYSVGVRILARYRGCSVAHAISQLNQRVATERSLQPATKSSLRGVLPWDARRRSPSDRNRQNELLNRRRRAQVMT